MVPNGLIVPALQRIEDALEDLASAGWELSQITRHPDLPWYLVPEAKQKATQAKEALSQVIPLIQEILMPFAEERVAFKAVQEAVLQVAREACREETKQEMPLY